MANEGDEANTNNVPNVGGDGNNDSLSEILHRDDDMEAESISHNSVDQAGMRVEQEAVRLSMIGDVSVSDFDVPIMGQLTKVNGKHVIISGGKPKPDWSGLLNPQPHRSPFQLRELFKVSSKDYKYRCEPLTTKITKDSNLVTVGETLKLQFEEIGVDTITYVKDPADAKNTISVLLDHAKLTKEEGIVLSKAMSSKFDSLDWENNGAATTVLLKSLDEKLYSKLIKNRSNDDTFVVTWLRLVDLLYPHSISTFEQYKEVIRKRRPTDYSAQDIEELCSDFDNDAKKCSYHYDHELTMTMLETIMTAGGESNEDFKAELRPLKKKLDRALMEIRFLDSSSKDKYLEKHGLSVTDILEEAESQYRYLKSRGKWYPAMRVSDRNVPNALPSLAMPIDSAKDLTAAQVLALLPRFNSSVRNGNSTSKGRKGNCYLCGSPDHWKDKCPLKKILPAKQVQVQSSEKKSWRRTPPSQGDPETIDKNGRKYFWCQNCKRWTETHGTADHVVGFNKNGKASKSDSNVDVNASASLAVEDPSVWVCTSPVFRLFGSDLMSELIGMLFGFVLFAHAFEKILTVFQVMIPIVKIFKRDLFFLSVGPLVSWILYKSVAWFVGSPRKEKKHPRSLCRKYYQHVERERKRNRRRSRRHRKYRRVGPVRHRGIYGARENAPSELDRNVMRILHDLRFELSRPTTAHVTPRGQSSRSSRPTHQRPNASRRRNPVRSRAVSENAPALWMAASGSVSPKTWGSLLKTALQAPTRFLNSMIGSDWFHLIWDSGASHCVTFDENDFISEIKDPGLLKKVQGIHDGLEVKGIGLVQWSLHAEDGGLRNFVLPALLVPKCTMRLLSTSVLLKTYSGETIHQDSSFMRLSGIRNNARRPSVIVGLDKRSGLFKSKGYRKEHVETAIASLSETINVVHSSNMNLTEAQKELLKWHHRLGHLSFRRIQSLLRSGTFAHTESARNLHRSASRIRHPPKCAACLYGKQSARPIPRNRSHVVRDVEGSLLDGNLLPGQQVSIDHFLCSTRGRTLESAGKTKEEKMYSGGILFVDHASDHVFVDYCITPNAQDSIRSKNKYEAICRDVGVVPQSYRSDNGKPFKAREFESTVSERFQSTRLAGVGAHHSNGKAENTIKRIMAIARTMMIHSAIHWPDVADASLWPMAVSYAVHIHNNVPKESTGLSPLDVFTKTRTPTRRLLDLHVWGCPTYVLDNVIADGKKLPRWKPRSTRRMLMGVSPLHSSRAPLVLNLETGFITPQFHIVYDDTFATVVSTPGSIPDFTSEVWKELFGNATHYLSDDGDDTDLINNEDEVLFREAQRHRELVASRLDALNPSEPLPDRPPPTTFLRDRTSFKDPQDDGYVLVRPPQGEAVTQVDRSDSSNVRSQGREGAQHGIFQREGASSSSNKFPEMENNLSSFDTSSQVQVDSQVSNEVSRQLTPIPGMRNNNLGPSNERIRPNLRASQSAPSENITQEISNSVQDSEGSGRPVRNRSKPILFSDEYNRLYYAGHELNQEDFSTGWVYVMPTEESDVYTFDEIIVHEAKDKWIAAAVEEISALEGHDTWVEESVDKAQSKILPGTWTFRLKRRPDGSVKKYKARFCVRGDLQEGNDDTHAPVVAFTTVRIFLVLSILLGWSTCTIDFVNAFVQATLTTPVWIHLPRGFKSTSGNRTCLRLKKSLYGLKTAPRLWHQHLRSALLDKLGFEVSVFDPCLFYRGNVLAILYVDDLGLAFPSQSVLKELSQFKDLGFNFTQEGTFSEFLGIQFSIDENARSVTMTQSGLIEKILKFTGMENCNPNKLPTAQTTLGNDENGVPMTERWSYASAVGMLLYLSTHTRPDISFAVSQIARFTHCPKQSHAKALKTLVRYLKGTCNQGLTFQLPRAPLYSFKTLPLEDYVDSDFAGLYRVESGDSPISAKSRTGYIITLCKCPLVWKSQLQTGIALSTQEAEYTALSQSARVLIPIQNICNEALRSLRIGPKSVEVPRILSVALEDNRGALTLAMNQRLTSRTKYYHVNTHWFWDLIKSGVFSVKSVSSELQCADFLTKPLPLLVFLANRKRVQGW